MTFDTFGRPFSYRLVVLTHGEAPALQRTIDAFFEYACPAPAEAYLHVDGARLSPAVKHLPRVDGGWTLDSSDPAVGFAGATRRAWQAAVDSTHPFVFWLEHDFILFRDIDLEEFAYVLNGVPTLAQMALMRTPVNEKEIAAGGVFESRPDEFEPRFGWPHIPDRGRGVPWLEHRSYFTTNPSLMRRTFMSMHRWPDYESECEGLFGIDLVQAGRTFGVWGEGEAWCEHVGERTGFGY